MIENSSLSDRQAALMVILRVLLFFAFTSGAGAVSTQDMQIPRQQAAVWLEQLVQSTWPGVKARLELGRVDSRLRLPVCTEFRYSLASGRRPGLSGSLEASCIAPGKWSIHLTYRLRLWGPALVARRSLPARTGLVGGDLEKREIEYELDPGAYLTNPELPGGAQLNRPVPAGRALLTGWIKRAPIIAGGQSVGVEVAGEGFKVRQEGIAQGSAAVGEAIKVKTRSGRLIQGIAQEDGSVLVRP